MKYRPYYIKDFMLNTHIENVLRTFLEMDDLNLLLYGIPNSGKTMLVEAIIREYYQLENDTSLPESNVMYINNLKEPGIQFYRNEMKMFCQTKSMIIGKKKMIIIDDLDTVTEQSQQVFRNYIDRYKSNVHFITACSNLQKITDSIQSRLQIIPIEPPCNDTILKNVKHILVHEKMEMDEMCQRYLLSISNHSIRSVINYLEKLFILDRPITLELCKTVCSNISFVHFEKYLQAFHEKDVKKGISILNELFYAGYSVIDIFDFFFLFIKSTESLDENTKYLMIPFLCKYITVFHTIHEDLIELALFTNSLFHDISKPNPFIL